MGIHQTNDKWEARFLVDDEDDLYVGLFNWLYKPSSGLIFRRKLVNDPSHYHAHVFLHLWFFNYPPKWMRVKFRSGDKLDLRKANLWLDTYEYFHDDWTRQPRAISVVDNLYLPRRDLTQKRSPTLRRPRVDSSVARELARAHQSLRVKLKAAEKEEK